MNESDPRNSVIMGANIAGIYGAQIFRSDDRPRYRRAFNIGIGVLVAGLTFAVIRYIDQKIRQRRKARTIEDPSSEDVVPAVFPSDIQPAPIVDGRRPSI